MVALRSRNMVRIILIRNLDLRPVRKFIIGHYVLFQLLLILEPTLFKITYALILIPEKILVPQIFLGEES